MFVFVSPPLKKLVFDNWIRGCPRKGRNARFRCKVVGQVSLPSLSGLPFSLWTVASKLIQRQILQANCASSWTEAAIRWAHRSKPLFHLLQFCLWPPLKWMDMTTHLLRRYFLDIWKPFTLQWRSCWSVKRDYRVLSGQCSGEGHLVLQREAHLGGR